MSSDGESVGWDQRVSEIEPGGEGVVDSSPGETSLALTGLLTVTVKLEPLFNLVSARGAPIPMLCPATAAMREARTTENLIAGIGEAVCRVDEFVHEGRS
jgi:hypothetical protein